MNNNSIIWKLIAGIAAIGAAVFVGVAYGDKIVAWVKKVLKIDAREEICFTDEDCFCEEEDCCEEAAEEEVVVVDVE